LPLLDDLRVGCLDELSHVREGLTTPVAQLPDPVADLLGCRFFVRHRLPHVSRASRWRSASIRAKPDFAPSSTPYCIVVSRSSIVAKRIVCVSFVWSPRSSNSSVCRWFWNVCTSRSGALISRNSPSTTPKAVRKRYMPPGRTSISSTTVPSPHHSG